MKRSNPPDHTSSAEHSRHTWQACSSSNSSAQLDSPCGAAHIRCTRHMPARLKSYRALLSCTNVASCRSSPSSAPPSRLRTAKNAFAALCACATQLLQVKLQGPDSHECWPDVHLLLHNPTCIVSTGHHCCIILSYTCHAKPRLVSEKYTGPQNTCL